MRQTEKRKVAKETTTWTIQEVLWYTSIMKIIDSHVHVFPPDVSENPKSCQQDEPCFELLYKDPKARMVSTESLLEAMDRQGISMSIVCSFPWRDPAMAKDHNDYILSSAQFHPDRLVPLASVDVLAPGAIKEAERALAAGAAGLGEIGVYEHDLTDDSVFDLLKRLARLCAEADKPLLLHTNEPIGHTYPGKSPMSIKGLYELISACPDTRFQLAHMGGGLFAFALLKREVRKVLKNCVFDTAATPYLYLPKTYKLFFDICDEQQILYGSDFPLLALARYEKDLAESGITKKQRAALLEQNAKRFWGL